MIEKTHELVSTREVKLTVPFNVTIEDTGGIDSLRFEQATSGSFTATPELQNTSRDGNDLILDVFVDSNIGGIPSATGQVRVTNYYSQSGFIESIVFPAGVLNDPNLAAVITDSAVDQSIDLNTAYNYQLASNTFTDDALDLLNISATLADGSDLPTWLTFDASTLTFSGTPFSYSLSA